MVTMIAITPSLNASILAELMALVSEAAAIVGCLFMSAFPLGLGRTVILANDFTTTTGRTERSSPEIDLYAG